MDRWRGRVAVVTGASEGIGETIVRSLASEGMKVAALARRKNLLEALENDVNSKVKAPGLVRGYPCDVSDHSQVTEAFRRIQKDLGPVSVLVNNAAAFIYTPLFKMDMKLVKPQVEVNLLGVMYGIEQCLESMRQGGINDGHIININSILGHRDVGVTGVAVYTASKHALTSLTTSLKRELAEEKMKTRVTSISPGLVKTTMSDWYTSANPEAPTLRANDVAETVIYALSAAPHINISELTIEPV